MRVCTSSEAEDLNGREPHIEGQGLPERCGRRHLVLRVGDVGWHWWKAA